jgi:putative peptidoglycan lipid II flippase
VAAANIVMAVLLWRLAGDLDRWLTAPWFDRAPWLAGCIIAGVVTYLAVLGLGGVRPRHLKVQYPVAGK